MAKKPVKRAERLVIKYDTKRWELLGKLRLKTMKIMELLDECNLKSIAHGSVARGDVSENSDIDICIISDKYKDTCAFNMYLNKMVIKMDNKYKNYLSPIGFNSKKFNSMIIPLTWEIKTTGKKIHI